MNIIKELVTRQIELPGLQSKVIRMKNDISDYLKLSENGVVHCGSSISDDGEAGCDWWLLKPMDDSAVSKSLATLDIYEDRDRGVYDDNDWDCSGKCMKDRPSIKRTKTRVLVKQSWALDF